MVLVWRLPWYRYSGYWHNHSICLWYWFGDYHGTIVLGIVITIVFSRGIGLEIIEDNLAYNKKEEESIELDFFFLFFFCYGWVSKEECVWEKNIVCRLCREFYIKSTTIYNSSKWKKKRDSTKIVFSIMVIEKGMIIDHFLFDWSLYFHQIIFFVCNMYYWWVFCSDWVRCCRIVQGDCCICFEPIFL